MRRWFFGFMAPLLVATILPTLPARAASTFADPAFQQQWQQDEALTPNFWGPLANATDGMRELYTTMSNHLCPQGQRCPSVASRNQRLAQYFDKGRMELTDGTLTNGLLAKELVTGAIQVGEYAFVHRDPPAIPVAGDATNAGPTYAMADKAYDTLAFTPGQPGRVVKLMRANGDLAPFERVGDYPEVQALRSDDRTSRDIANVFATYRDQVGLQSVGYATTNPFWVNVTVRGIPRDVLVQVFERRVLTYTPANPDAFKVEMGNIGQHYYQWRYGSGPPLPAPTVDPATSAVTVRLADDGSTVTLAPGERFALMLGDGYDWTIAVADQAVVSVAETSGLVRGTQGIYAAHRPGTTTLTAMGSPVCARTQPPCSQPSRIFQVSIVVA